ncbi:M16 family metallopeptidase [Actinoplanes philippinensis]|uniref:M16 family metallopeptidase n=1 Tax=Actinoplanes philippinensis TaxID=35752 RepID=UPI00340E7431
MTISQEVDGVPVLIAPTTGPMSAGLAFRVGFVDETLPRRGITHLIEHLALHSLGMADYHYNGATGVEHTVFHMQGAEPDIVAFLNGVCAGLGDLPLERLAVEKEILRTEQNSRGEGPAGRLALWRHGARDYGLANYPEWGLGAIGPDDLRAWVARYFHRDNAVLWIAGPGVPAGLRLDLPGGTRQAAPAPSSILPVRPAYFPGSEDAVAWDAVVDRGEGAAVFAEVLRRSMFRSLRQESGLSYNVVADYLPRADGRAVITAAADSLPEKQGAVLGGLVDVLAAARLGMIDEAEVTAVVNKRREELRQAEATGGRLPAQAFDVLDGRTARSLDEVLAELDAVTRDDVVAIAAAACADGLLMTPGETEADWAGYAAAPPSSVPPVDGVTHRSADDAVPQLVIGERGISLVRPESTTTVLFDECSAVLTWPDGGRVYIGHDAVQLRVEPVLYPDGAAMAAALDARTRPELRVTMPPRDPERIPRPAAPEPPARSGSVLSRALRRIRRA